MSVPIKYCVLVKAADDPEAFKRVHPIMHRNIKGGHFSVYPCDCDPPCRQLTDDEGKSLMKRFTEPVGAKDD